MEESIKTRYEKVLEQVISTSNKRYWQKGKTKVIVVTKRQRMEDCLEVISAGATDIGENYIEEANQKYSLSLSHDVNFHLIGHLQSRKTKYLDPLFSYMHTIDSVDISEKVNKLFTEKGKCLKVLVEVNFTGEISKSGFKICNENERKDFLSIIKGISCLPAISLCGLMTMGYYPETPETNREIFVKCRTLLKEIQNMNVLPDFNELSMGTSGDFVTAIEEGATFVRIGELIMGQRLEKAIK